jgi:hypothetical protein
MLFAWSAKTAADQAREAANEVRDQISRFDTMAELSAAITIIEEIMRLQRTQAWEIVWDIVLDRYATLLSHLARSKGGGGLTEAHRTSIQTAIARFRIMVEVIEKAFDMDFSAQILKLIVRLTELTKEDKLVWEETGNRNIYLAKIEKTNVLVGKAGSDVTFGGYSLQILDEAGQIIDGTMALYAIRDADRDAFKRWDLLRDLYELARRSALKSEKVVSDLLSTLEAIR